MKGKIGSLQAYLDNLQSKGQYWFLRQETMASLKLTKAAFKLAAYRLASKGKISRVRDDFYIIVPPEYSAMGSLPATWFIDAFMRYLDQQYYVSLLTAAALQGATHQQVTTFQVITNKRTRPITMDRIHIDFFYKKKIQSHFYVSLKTPTGMMNVSTPEMTAFDLLRYSGAVGQINHIATVLCELVEKIKSEKLAQLIIKGDVEVTIAQRLGYLLDTLQLPINLEPLMQALKNKKTKQRLLVMGNSQTVIEHSRRWHILVNEVVEPDEL
jgi:predicted transcriptional regulator of viral defense system